MSSRVRGRPAKLGVRSGCRIEATIGLEDVQRVTEAALAYLDLDDLLTELLQRVTDILQADTAAVLLVEDDGRTLAARAAKGLEEEVERGFRLPVGRGFAGRVAATREPVVIPDLDNSPVDGGQPSDAREGGPLASRGPADRRGRGDRGAARRHA